MFVSYSPILSLLRGTAFLLGSGDDQLLITARHLCNDELEEVLLLRHPGTNDGNAYQLPAIRVGMDVAPTADFAIFRMTKPIAWMSAQTYRSSLTDLSFHKRPTFSATHSA